MDSHVRERIVGAAILVALGVWLIPWVLDGPESEPVIAAAPELQLPSPDSASPIRTETVEFATRQAAATPVSAPAQGARASDPSANTPPPIVRTTPGLAAEPATEPVAAAAPPAARTTAATGALAAWSVQLGSFSDRANAARLADRVADFGHAAQVSEIRSNGETMYRVRVDGFATRERAEAARSSLSTHGIIPAQVVPAD